MAGSSPAPRRSHQWQSPQRSAVLGDILNDDRNSESRHRILLEAAKKEHDRVREEAERVYRDHLQKEEHAKLLAERKKEEERIRNEELLAAERFRLLALKEKKVEIPEIPPTPTAPEPVKKTAPASTTPGQTPTANGTNGTPASPPTLPPLKSGNIFGLPKPQATSQSTSLPSLTGLLAKTPAPTAPASQAPSTVAGGSSLFGANAQANGVKPPSVQDVATETTLDRHSVIHKNLKTLRKSLADQAKSNKALKDRMGDMRREIRKSVGQLTGGAPGVNRTQQSKITGLLREALANNVQSQLVDPSDYVIEPRPATGQNAGPLPSLFLYLLNIFSKATISQFINEAAARPETADPVGVCVAATFSEPDFHWRGAPLIDILLAKFRIVCPVLFGYRGSEKTEQGRARLGWWKDNGRWVPEQQHMDRMTGLGAGFAAISLRKFAMSKKQNPYPPRNYWSAMARIVNTPPADMSSTQCVVLKSMIQNYEIKFIEAYGNAALAALRLCLVEFPARAVDKTPAVHSLEVLGQLLRKDAGLVLG
ncbi:putative nucleoporin GLE1 [Echria macrotheca]|uniref:mRNA export factor GLE1 n=1 Tax=Echria macrotheca TaxID=438768 RepID=A0AAJ0FEK3_9PEZI|nr:putative nucleoporin GLE1 [Echria macrotheca]